jgi:hypothetical protein
MLKLLLSVIFCNINDVIVATYAAVATNDAVDANDAVAFIFAYVEAIGV